MKQLKPEKLYHSPDKSPDGFSKGTENFDPEIQVS
jgi:hypothetical protein